ncbi:hypothetical protein CYMTET_18961, partial [Cymbomonas tetramitiformis]
VKPGSSGGTGALVKGLWLVWRYEGSSTLHHHLGNAKFPTDLCDPLLGGPIGLPGQKKRWTQAHRKPALQLQIVQKIMQQIFESLHKLHMAGLVHRDVKPQNILLCERDRRFKLIDLGACADLRTGDNFAPDETVLDPKYAAPEEYVIPLDEAPDLANQIAPVALAMGTQAWMQHCPDRFDMYSCGVTFMQLCCPPLRSELGLQRFNRELKEYNYDLSKWRRYRSMRQADTVLLDAGNGAGWDLAQQMLLRKPKRRPTALAASQHEFFSAKLSESTLLPREPVRTAVTSVSSSVTEAASEAYFRLQRLQLAVSQRQETVMRQTSRLKALKREAADPKVIAKEEAKLQKLEKDLGSRISTFNKLYNELRRNLGYSETQIRAAEEESDILDTRIKQARRMGGSIRLSSADRRQMSNPGWATQVKRAAGTAALATGWAAKTVSGAFQSLQDTRTQPGNAKSENNAAEIVLETASSAISSLASFWGGINEESSTTRTLPAEIFEQRGAEGVTAEAGEQKVVAMRTKLQQLELEVSSMTSQMQAMESRIRKQQELILSMEHEDDLDERRVGGGS